ncbi:hypothetical protein QFZ51_004438 [Chitinophaga sp. W3I9]
MNKNNNGAVFDSAICVYRLVKAGRVYAGQLFIVSLCNGLSGGNLKNDLWFKQCEQL